MALPETNPVYGPFFGVMGASSAIIFSGKCFEKKVHRQIEQKWMKTRKNAKFVQISHFFIIQHISNDIFYAFHPN